MCIRDSPSTKGLNASSLPVALARLAPRLSAFARMARAQLEPHLRRRTLTVYVASNRPAVIAALRPALAAALGETASLQDWRGLTSKLRGAEDRGGLLDALVEHDLCVHAPVAFYGSPFSTWANLITARRRAAHRPSFALEGGQPVPSCKRE
eukprot:6139139-Prymnesium_polylepis.1